MPEIILKNLIPKESDLTSRMTWVEFKGIQFKIRYISRATLMTLAEQCAINGYDSKTKARQQKLDTEKFTELLAKTITKDWKNCTLKVLSNLMPLNIDDFTPEQLEEDLPFNEENMKLVFSNVHELDNFLQECSTDASAFRPANDEAVTKNSSTSQIGNSTKTN